MHSGRYNRSVEVTACETMVECWLYLTAEMRRSVEKLEGVYSTVGRH